MQAVRVVTEGKRGNDRKVGHVRARGALVRGYFHAQPFNGARGRRASRPGRHLAAQALNKAPCQGGVG